MSPHRRERRSRNRWPYAGGLAAASIIVAIIGVIIGGGRSTVPQTISSRLLLVDLFAPRDIGRLPSDSGWCSLGRTAEHCWLLDEASGNATDMGSGANWHLSAQGSPRRGVSVSVPVADATGWAGSGDSGAFFDGVSGNGLANSSATQTVDATNLVTVTTVFVTAPGSGKRLYSQIGSNGFEVYVEAAGTIAAYVDGTSTATARNNTAVDDGAVHCASVVFDGRTANAALFYLDGADDTSATKDLSGTGSWTSDATATIGNATALGGDALPGGVLRTRVDYSAISLADHARICGSLWWFSLDVAKVKTADVVWTQTGSQRCYDQSASAALCAPGGKPSPAWTSALGSVGWAIEKDRTNRVLQNESLDSTPWAGLATVSADNAVAPHGLKIADSVTVTDATTLYQKASGYTASTALNLHTWVKCSSGTLKMKTDGAALGDWSVDCSTVGGAWAHLTSSHAAVTETTAWQSDSTGDATLIFTSDATGVSVDVWAPTLTEVVGYSVIPTDASTASTGAALFYIDNDPANYFKGRQGEFTIKADFVVAASGSSISFTGTSGSPPPGSAFYSASLWWWYDGTTPNGVHIWRCNLTGGLSGVDTLRVRWNSGVKLTATEYAECYLNTVKQTWALAPSSAWTSADPSFLYFGRTVASQQNNAVWQRIQIYNAP